jgi:soluble lytic murein transglycosylase-like protein
MPGGREADPAKVAAAILQAADWAGVDPILVLAMIEVESGFDPAARSNRGARGLMQVRPATLWAEAARSGLAGEDPHAPELNVPAGVLYYRRLLDTFGNKYLALVAYNAGPNRVSGLLRSGGIPDRFREYPRRVFAAEERLRQSLRIDSQ